MPNKTPAVISTLLTAFLLIVFGIVPILVLMLTLNGASEKQGTTAMVIAFVCQGAGTILTVIFTWRFTKFLISKFNWNSIVVVIAAVFLGVLFGTGISFLAILISILLAGIR